jgi:NAD(P)-dependent dehydrogenase (short-subunit alcohol dehydrogenase family)
MNLKKSTSIITGGAHRVGKAIALELANYGSNIILHYGRSKEKAEDTVNEIKDLGVEVEAYSAASFIKKSLIETSYDDWNKSIDINLKAPFLITKKTEHILKSKNDSLIVNISDLSGVYPWMKFASHGISKSGLIHLTKISARELAPNIRVNCILPGPILPPPHMSGNEPEWIDMINNIPLKKSGDPQQIGHCVRFLAENEYVTGAIINVDGGESLIGPMNH